MSTDHEHQPYEPAGAHSRRRSPTARAMRPLPAARSAIGDIHALLQQILDRVETVADLRAALQTWSWLARALVGSPAEGGFHDDHGRPVLHSAPWVGQVHRRRRAAILAAVEGRDNHPLTQDEIGDICGVRQSAISMALGTRAPRRRATSAVPLSHPRAQGDRNA